MENKAAFFSEEGTSVCPSVLPVASPCGQPTRPRLTLRDAREAVLRQVGGLEQFAERGRTDPLYSELLLCMAELTLFPDAALLRVAGVELPAGVVKEVYGMLTAEHLREVRRAFCRITSPVRNRKAYLRTALYNAVFELEAGIINEVAGDWGTSDAGL